MGFGGVVAVAALAEEAADGVAWAREGFLTGNPAEYPPISWELLLEKLKELGIKGAGNLAVGYTGIQKEIKNSKE